MITPLQLVRKILKILLFLLFVVLLGCSSEPATQQVKTPGTETPVQKVPTPLANVKLVKEKTHQVYKRYCAQCHGRGGRGDGVNAPYLVVPPRDHTKSDYLETRSDKQLFDVIKFGGLAVGRAPCMPAWGHTLEDEIIILLVSYIRYLCNCKAL